MAEYTLIPDCGVDGDDVTLIVWLPRFSSRPSLRSLRILAEIYALGGLLNARSLERFGLEVVSTQINSDDGDYSLSFEFDADYSDVYTWREEVTAAATRIIRTRGGTVRLGP